MKTAWPLFKVFMNKNTIAKIILCKGKGRKEIFEICDSKHVPEFLGGESKEDFT